MDVVGEAILSAFLMPLFEKLTSTELLDFARKKQVDTELQKWESRLLEIHAVLNDAEDKQMTNPAVKIWLSKLQDLAYDVEDILDVIATEAKLKAESQARTSAVQKLISTVPMFDKNTSSKLRQITARLQEIVTEKNSLELRTHVEMGLGRANERLPTTSLVKDPFVYGREKDKEAILGMLMHGQSSNSPFSVISIFGMGGVGKMTLAQLVYNDEGLKFDYKAWACVSDDFDILKTTKAILSWESCEANDLNLLQAQLKKKLSGKKFLIILDDVWSENYEDWTTLSSPFVAGAPGSKIIVTTRSKDVSLLMGSLCVYELKELSHDDCLSIFAQHALSALNFDSHPDLKEIGHGVVKRCKGLPLAAKTLGGLLRGKHSREEWGGILNSKMWDLVERKSDIIPALRFSYCYLPSYLKRYFAYCAIFPKDYEFSKNELVLLWMAERFLQQSEDKKSKESLGHEYFHELLSRSFFQQSRTNKSCFVMHDLIRDLAQSVSGEICFNLDDKWDGAKSHERVRHSAFTAHSFDFLQRFEVLNEMKALRTLLALPAFSKDHYITSRLLHDLVPKFKRLRALSLAGYRIVEFPSSIGALKHLRYLNLSYTKIGSLPESLCKLFNLQTLRLRGCQKLIKVHTGIGHLTNLRYLDICGTDSLQEMPPLISNLNNLCYLTKFIVGAGDGLRIKELMAFSHLQGLLHILGLHNVTNIQDAEFANLKEKQGLTELALEWIDDFHGSRNERDELQVLNSLQPHQNVAKLSVTSYAGTKFPSWIGNPTFNCMVHLQLRNCPKIETLPLLGRLPSLKDLSIKGMDGVKEVGAEFYGAGLVLLWLFNL